MIKNIISQQDTFIVNKDQQLYSVRVIIEVKLILRILEYLCLFHLFYTRVNKHLGITVKYLL